MKNKPDLFKGKESCGAQAQESGSALLIAVMLLFVFAALSLAQMAVVQKNVQSSRYFLSYSDLHEYAESGVQIALHDLRHNLSGNGGQVGTLGWASANDVGKDGVPGTSDEGEGDGVPTAGEPNVSPVPIGPPAFGAGLTLFVTDYLPPDVKHIVATAANRDASASVDVYARRETLTVPRVGAIYVEPGVALDLSGSSLSIDGNDHNLDGSLGTSAPVYGIATNIGSPLGVNQAALLSALPKQQYNQVKGLGGSPSLGERDVNLKKLIETFKALKTHTISSGTYTSPTLGDSQTNDLHVTVASGDVHLSGNSAGAGVFVIEGSLTLTGNFSFQGLVLVTGDVRVSGSGTQAKVLGSLMAGQSLADDVSTTKGRGAMKVFYSNEALAKIDALASNNYSVVYYNDK